MKRERQAYHHGDLREALVAAGTKLLRQKGFHGLTLRACARAAGVSHAAPKHHFPTLADLLAEIAARGFEAFVAALDESKRDAAQPRQALEAMCRAYIGFALKNAAVYELMFRQRSSELRSLHLTSAAVAAWQQLETAVATMLGPAFHGDVKTKAGFVWASVHGAATLLIDRRLPPTVQEAMLIEDVVTGIATALAA
jgi:AcrR family transcriptional regulator